MILIIFLRLQQNNMYVICFPEKYTKQPFCTFYIYDWCSKCLQMDDMGLSFFEVVVVYSYSTYSSLFANTLERDVNFNEQIGTRFFKRLTNIMNSDFFFVLNPVTPKNEFTHASINPSLEQTCLVWTKTILLSEFVLFIFYEFT